MSGPQRSNDLVSSSIVTLPLPSATDLAHWTLAAQHPLTRQWSSDDESRLARLAEDHKFDLRMATDLDFAAKGATLAPGHEPREMLSRCVTVSSDLSALLSIRFEGLDPNKPFVDASLLSRPLAEGDLAQLGTAAAHTFGSFGPRYVRMWSAAPTDAFPSTHRDRRFLAAPLSELVGAGRIGIPDELSLTPTTDLARWDDVVAAYAAVAADHPRHTDQAHIQDAEDLQQIIDAGTLFDVMVDHTWAGWIGATTETSSSLGLPCYEVQEIILAPGYRGHGYGAHLARLLASELPDQNRVLIGTIHADNRGAQQAARRAGRHDVGGWLQVPLTRP